MHRTRLLIIAGIAVLCVTYTALVAIPQAAIDADRSPLTTTPADVGLNYETFEISPQDSELVLHGWWIPAPATRATLVFIHGGGSNRHSRYFESLKFYRAMVDQGVSLAVIDLRNHGDSDSDNRGLQFGRTEKYDALAALDWARQKTPGLPLFAMGISMGGATIIQAAAAGAPVDGLILLDALLDTDDTFKQGAWVSTGLPAGLFGPSAWAGRKFHGLPDGAERALDQAAGLNLPILAIQDPDDPVTRARFSAELAQRNAQVTLWLAPPIDPEHPNLAWKKRWGSHVSAFAFYPEETVEQIMLFIDRIIANPAASSGTARRSSVRLSPPTALNCNEYQKRLVSMC